MPDTRNYLQNVLLYNRLRAAEGKEREIEWICTNKKGEIILIKYKSYEQ